MDRTRERFERRRVPRRTPAADEPLSQVRLRAGRELTVVDLSNSGALVEGTARLLPGTHVDVHIIAGDGRTLVRSRVLRAYVSYVGADVVRYRGALAFERQVDTRCVGYAVPEVLTNPAVALGNAYPDPSAAFASHAPERVSA